MAEQNEFKVPKKMQSLFDEIAGSTDTFCAQFLYDEYAYVCRKLTAALARKRPSPLLRGRSKTWAAGIVYTAGSINFLFDPSQDPHMTAKELSENLGVAASTMLAKRRIIERALDVGQFHPEYTLSSLMAQNPLVWMLEVDGIVIRSGTKLTADVLEATTRLRAIVRAGVGVDNVDVPAASRRGIIVMRTAPRELQEIAYEEGLIPYIPDDLDEEDDWFDEPEEGPTIIRFPVQETRTPPGKDTNKSKSDEPSLFQGFEE